MGARVGTAEAFSELNLAPLIDVVLVVLIIMMVNIPIQIEEMGIKLPSSEKTDIPKDVPKDQLVIAVYANGDMALNRTLMTKDRLLAEITRRLRPMADKNVFIDADPTIPYGRVVEMVDLAREGGAAKVGLAKLKESGPLEATDIAEGALERGVLFGSPGVVGAMTEKMADEAFAPLRATIDQCYETALARNGQLSGRMILKVTVGPQGELLDPPSILTSNVDDQDLATCITTILPQITFPELGYTDDGTGKTALVRYPLLFSPG